MPTFIYQNNEIEYTLTRNAKKNVNFRIKSNGEIAISAPKYVTKAELNKMIAKRAEWMVQNQAKAKKKKQNSIPQFLQSGNAIFLNGAKYIIKILPDKENKVTFQENYLVLHIKETHLSSQEYINHFWEQWQKEIMYYICDKLVDKNLLQLTKYHLKKPEITIRTMTSRWGSCIPSKCKITLNKNLIFPPQKCLEYVVLHELAHLVEANHSKRFYAIIAEIMPDWKERKKILNDF